MKAPVPPALSIAVLLLALLGALEFGVLHLLAPLENRLLDSFQRQAAAGLSPDPQIVLVDIDDASLARMQARAESNALSGPHESGVPTRTADEKR